MATLLFQGNVTAGGLENVRKVTVLALMEIREADSNLFPGIREIYLLIFLDGPLLYYHGKQPTEAQ